VHVKGSSPVGKAPPGRDGVVQRLEGGLVGVQPGGEDRLRGQQRLARELEGLGDDEVHAGLGRPRDLLVEHGPDGVADAASSR